MDIKEKVLVKTKFSFLKVDVSEIKIEIENLDIKKSGTFSNIPVFEWPLKAMLFFRENKSKK